MASSFPGGIDNFVDPLIGSPLNSPSHALQHQNVNDAVEKIETYMGLVKVIPTSAVNGTVGATGTVTFTAASSVSVNNAFTSLYENYRIEIVGFATSNADLNFRFRTAGVDLSTAVYQYASQGFYTGTRNDAAATGQTSISFTPSMGNARQSGYSIEVYGPNTTNTWKTTNANGSFAHDAVGVIVRNVAGACNSVTQFDGFTLSNGTITGSLRIYGYRN